jgi:hypothetical protein
MNAPSARAPTDAQARLLLGSETTVDGGWVGTATTHDDAATTRTSGAR